MKYKCRFLLVLAFMIVFLFYSVGSVTAMAEEQNPESAVEVEPEPAEESVTEQKPDQLMESATEQEPEQAMVPTIEQKPEQAEESVTEAGLEAGAVNLGQIAEPTAGAVNLEQNVEASAEPTELGQDVEASAKPVDSAQGTVTTLASENTPELVSTGQELQEWLESHKNTGGTVKLADHVVMDDEYYSYCPNGINMPSVFVDTDKYTITVTGEVDLLSDGNLIFSGQPEGKGIFYVTPKGVLSMQGITVESGQCAVWQEEGAGLVVGSCHISGSIHYAETPFVMDYNSVCAVVEKGQTLNDVLPAQVSCTVSRQGCLSHNEWLPVAWNLEGYEKQQEERRRFRLQGSFLHAASAEPVLCTVAYNDYPMTFMDVKASVSGNMYMFRGWHTKPENLPITVMSEYSFDGENWLMYEETNVTGAYGGFFIAVNSEQFDMAVHPNLYIRLQWDDNGTKYFSNVLCYAADNLEQVEDIGGSRGGGTSITNPPDSPQKPIDDASAQNKGQGQITNHNINSGNDEPTASADISQTEKESKDIDSNTAGGGQASNEDSLNVGTVQPPYLGAPNTDAVQPPYSGAPNTDAVQPPYSGTPNKADDQPLYEESKTGNAEQPLYAESETDKKEENVAVSSVYGENIASPPIMNEQSMESNIRKSNTIVIATGFVLLSSIAGIAGFCFHSRPGTKR